MVATLTLLIYKIYPTISIDQNCRTVYTYERGKKLVSDVDKNCIIAFCCISRKRIGRFYWIPNLWIVLIFFWKIGSDKWEFNAWVIFKKSPKACYWFGESHTLHILRFYFFCPVEGCLPILFSYKYGPSPLFFINICCYNLIDFLVLVCYRWYFSIYLIQYKCKKSIFGERNQYKFFGMISVLN